MEEHAEGPSHPVWVTLLSPGTSPSRTIHRLRSFDSGRLLPVSLGEIGPGTGAPGVPSCRGFNAGREAGQTLVAEPGSPVPDATPPAEAGGGERHPPLVDTGHTGPHGAPGTKPRLPPAGRRREAGDGPGAPAYRPAAALESGLAHSEASEGPCCRRPAGPSRLRARGPHTPRSGSSPGRNATQERSLSPGWVQLPRRPSRTQPHKQEEVVPWKC